MWYSGSDGLKTQIGYATSEDGIIWIKATEPVLVPGDVPAFDDIDALTPTVLYNGTKFEMWYSGFEGTTYSIGRAEETR